MVETDLSGQFQQMCKQAEYSLQEIQDAIQSSRNQLRTEAASTKGKGSETTHDPTRAATTHATASGRWQVLRDQWHAHVAKLREDAERKKASVDATHAAHYAEEAEGDAQEAIQFAADAIGEAERAVLNAVRARTKASVLANSPANRA